MSGGYGSARPIFEETALPHLDAAYNLARWLTRDASDAEDVVQESYLRAFRFFAGYRGGDSRVWLLKIVRNTFYTWLQKNHPHENVAEIDDDMADAKAGDPETLLIRET
jgi:RNA polymerase sigma-70 factor (ECF subfamily)